MLWVSLGIIVLPGVAPVAARRELHQVETDRALLGVCRGDLRRRPRPQPHQEPDERADGTSEVAWSRLNASWGGFFAFMGLANLYVAFNYSTDTWVDFKLFGSLGLMLVFVIGQSMMLTRYLDKAEPGNERKSNNVLRHRRAGCARQPRAAPCRTPRASGPAVGPAAGRSPAAGRPLPRRRRQRSRPRRLQRQPHRRGIRLAGLRADLGGCRPLHRGGC